MDIVSIIIGIVVGIAIGFGIAKFLKRAMFPISLKMQKKKRVQF